jgi:uncharacterized protein YggU (UPF0235/DUF167 family)
VRLTPKGGRDVVDGLARLADGTSVLKARVRAAPEDGAANEALRRLLAKSFGVPASAVTLTSGATARVKQLRIAGDAAVLAARFQVLAGEAA